MTAPKNKPPPSRQSRRRDARLAARTLRKSLIAEADAFRHQLEDYSALKTFFSQDSSDPKNVLQAFNEPGWAAAVHKEFDSLGLLGSWEEIPEAEAALLDTVPLPVKWVFKSKYSSDGTLIKKKARLVAQGCFEEYFDNVYAPVLRRESFKFLWNLGVKKGWSADLCDISNAFLQSRLDDNHIVLLKEIPGFPCSPGHVRRLRKSLYGLRVAPALWNAEISSFFVHDLGLSRSTSDPCLYFLKNENGDLQGIIGLYVDDVIIMGSPDFKTLVKSSMKLKYSMTDSGLLQEVLGLRVTQVLDEGTDRLLEARISAPRHITDLLTLIPDRFRTDQFMEKAPKHPMSKKFVGNSGKLCGVEDQACYRKIIGSILYISIVRPDVAFAIMKLSRYVSCPTQECLAAAVHLVLYLFHTKHLAMVWKKSAFDCLRLYCDADWASDTVDRKSVSGCCLFDIGGIVSFLAKRQASTANSSCESETIALGKGTREALYLDKLIFELEGSLPAIKIFEDNKGAFDVAQGGPFFITSNLKHVDVQHFITADYLASRSSSSIHLISTNEQIADIFTKPLESDDFLKKRSWLGMIEDDVDIANTGGVS
jgi:hypothetical protein